MTFVESLVTNLTRILLTGLLGKAIHPSKKHCSWFDAGKLLRCCLMHCQGICDAGADVLKIGLAGTEEMYSAVSEFNADAGVEVTASHNQ